MHLRLNHWLAPTATAFATLLAAQLAGELAAQATSFHRIATPAYPEHVAWDVVRQRTTFLMRDSGRYHHWEWDGSNFEERVNALSLLGGINWFGSGPQPGQLTIIANHGADVGTWDGAHWHWQAASPWSGANRFCFDERRGRIVAMAGFASSSYPLREWDGSTWWTIPWTGGPSPRSYYSLAYDPISQRCLLYGGLQGQTVLDDVWAWGGSIWTPLATNAPPGPRMVASMGWSQSLGAMILYGGYSGYPSSPDTTTWRLTGSTWQQILTPNDPGTVGSLLAVNGLIADPLGLLYIADDHGIWRFDGTDWSMVEQLARPRYTSGTAAAYDPVRQQTVLFGTQYGTDAGQLFDTRFRDIVGATQPPNRENAAMCWSTPDQAVLLFGGERQTSTFLADTWTWDGAAWLQRTPAQSPPPRAAHAMAEDPTGGVLLFGGWTFAGARGDHWHWNGTNWTQVTPATLPSPSLRCHAALDPLRSRVVMMTGPAQNVAETWEWDGLDWTLAGGGMPAIQSPLPMAFDPLRAKVVAMHATNAEWNGSTWTTIPGPANSYTLAVGPITDLHRSRLLAFGQGSNVAQLTDKPATVQPIGYGCAIGPAPVLDALNHPTVDNPGFALDVTTLAASSPTFLVLGFGGPSQPLGAGCTSYLPQPITALFSLAQPNGHARYPLPIPNDPGLRGVELLAQAAIIDPPRGLYGSLTITRALQITIGD